MANKSQDFATTIVVGTYGSESWCRLAERRAISSARRQGVPVIHEHRDTLAQARNAALDCVETEWTIHLDADDELEAGYVKAMASGEADLRVPMIRQVRNGHSRSVPFWPHVYGHDHDCTAECLRWGNWIVIGAAVRTEMAREVGWEEFGWSEDWAMWARCWQAGATIERIPKAIYVAYMRTGSRNRVMRGVSLDWHRKIERAVFGEVTV